MSKRKLVLKFFSSWNDAREERWLEEMALSGWHLVSGPLLYCFEQGPPARMRYRMDYRAETVGLDEYLKLCRDSGWERVFAFWGWQYFRTASESAPEIYTDAASRIAKYRRLLNTTVSLAIATMTANVICVVDSFRDRNDPVEIAFRWLVAALALAWVYVFARIILHIRRQRRSQ